MNHQIFGPGFAVVGESRSFTQLQISTIDSRSDGLDYTNNFTQLTISPVDLAVTVSRSYNTKSISQIFIPLN